MPVRLTRITLTLLFAITAVLRPDNAFAADPPRFEPSARFLPSAHGVPFPERHREQRPESPAGPEPALQRWGFMSGSLRPLNESDVPFDCNEPIAIDGALADGLIDPARIGFSPNMPGDGWRASGVTFAAIGGCDLAAGVQSPSFQLQSYLRYAATGNFVYLSQTSAPIESANVLEHWGASFWSKAYRYDAYTDAVWDPAGAPGGTSDEILRALIARLAPDLSLDCFYQRKTGTWADLLARGIGDVRPQIPSGFSESYFDLNFFEQPASNCGSATGPVGGTNFFVSYWREDDASWINVSAYELDPGYLSEPVPGYIDDSWASWTNTRYYFTLNGVQGSAQAGLGLERLKAMAKALDPGIDFTCFVTTTALTPSDVTRLGFHIPTAPSGYSLTSSWLYRYGASAQCATAPPEIFNLYWSLENEETAMVINAGVWRDASQGAMTPSGWISDGYIYWNDAMGTIYSVSSYSSACSSLPSREILLEVAKSMDPTLDPTTLAGMGAVLGPAGSQKTEALHERIRSLTQKLPPSRLKGLPDSLLTPPQGDRDPFERRKRRLGEP